jgi:hypothetical protein
VEHGQALDHGRRGADGDLVLAGTPAEKNRDLRS